jgi:hypothetical protein
MPETSGEVTVEEYQDHVCPHCKHKFRKKVVITQEVSLEFDFGDYDIPHNEGYD